MRPLRFKSRPASDQVTCRMTVGSCRRATDALVIAGCICCQQRMRLPAGTERDRIEEAALELWRLGNWIGRLIATDEVTE